MSARSRVLSIALALACSSSDEPGADAPPRGGTGGLPAEGTGASAAGAPDSGLAPTSAGGAGLPSAECAVRQRSYFEDRGFLAAGTVRGLLEALDEPEAFWEQLPSCSGEP